MKQGLAIAVLTRKFYPWSNIALGLAIYLIGVVISLSYGILEFFLNMWLFALGAFGIVWVSAFWTWIFSSIDKILKELASVFRSKSAVTVDNLKTDFMRLISSDKRAFLASIPSFVFVAYHIRLLSSGGIALPFEVPEMAKTVAFASYTVLFFSICLYFLSASAYLIFSALVFLRRITRIPITLSLLQVRRKVDLEETIGAVLIGTVGWFIGVSLVMTVLFAYSSFVIIGFLAFVIVVGLLFFFIPQMLIHNSICEAKGRLLKKIKRKFKTKTRIPLEPKCDVHEALLLCTLFEHVDRIKEWPFETTVLLQLFGSAIIPVATAIIGIVQK